MLIVIVHPELWNGGADRCTVGMIRHFLKAGHRVAWYTNWMDKYWSKEEFHNVDIHEVSLPLHPGDWLTQNIAIAWKLVFSDLNPDLFVIDHSARWYAYLIGLIEDYFYEDVDTIMVNSNFTKKNFVRVMPQISPSKLMVVYPPCDVDALGVGEKAVSRKERPQNSRYTFLSLNRFWPEKRLDIIVEAAVNLKNRNRFPRILLAGSVMPSIPESKIYYDFLQERVKEYGVGDLVEFVPSPTEAEKFALFRECDTVLYTPADEHFGIVPIEALEQRRPVIVCNSGGPAETVLEDITGTKISFPDENLLADAMEKHMLKPVWPALDDENGFELQRKRFEKNFSLKGFGDQIDDAIAAMFPNQKSSEMRRRCA